MKENHKKILTTLAIVIVGVGIALFAFDAFKSRKGLVVKSTLPATETETAAA